MENLSNLSLTILEIISEQRNVHSLIIKGQIQEMSQLTGKTVSDSEINDAIDHLVTKNLIKQLPTPNTYVLTEEGKNYL